MKYQAIQKIGKDMGINTYRTKKEDLIHAIQKKENNFDCYATARVTDCGEEDCLWRSDCLAVDNNGAGN
jgi:hypothetical protein